MYRFLPRGYCVKDNTIITKVLSEDENWQIYSTNANSYAIAIKNGLYEKWVLNCKLPKAMFVNDTENDCRFYAGSYKSIISSLEKGPYPTNELHIERFSAAFKNTVKFMPNADLRSAVYIEDLSLILPTSFEEGNFDNDVIYGKWLTKGVNISVYSIDRIKKIAGWLSEEFIIRSATAAGFSITNSASRGENSFKSSSDKPQQKHIEPEIAESNVGEKPEGKRFSLIGRPDLEQFFNDNIIDVIQRKEEYEKMGVPFPGATILYGPPGCGKTYAIDRLAEFLGWNRFDIDSSSIGSPYIHETSKKTADIFNLAINNAPSILVIDEMEAFLSSRSSDMSGSHRIEEVDEFLRRIPEAVSKGVLVFAMTNMIDSIDSAVRRKGRFDNIIEVKMATAEEIEALLISRLANLPVANDVDAKKIALSLQNRPMSDITFALKEAGRLAVKNSLNKINAECFDTAVKVLLEKDKDKESVPPKKPYIPPIKERPNSSYEPTASAKYD